MTLAFLPSIGFFEVLITVIFFVAPVIAAGIHCLTNKQIESGIKAFWLAVILFIPMLGAVVYFLLGRGRKETTPN